MEMKVVNCKQSKYFCHFNFLYISSGRSQDCLGCLIAGFHRNMYVCIFFAFDFCQKRLFRDKKVDVYEKMINFFVLYFESALEIKSCFPIYIVNWYR
jgi:hypothetical protein